MSSSCTPVETVDQLFDWQRIPVNGIANTTLEWYVTPAHPCGSQAKYIFSDSFSIESANASFIYIDQQNIAHGYDAGKFKNIENKNNADYWQSRQFINLEA